MTVYDELFSGNEYSEMELEEFLEFLVRLAYIMPQITGLDESLGKEAKQKVQLDYVLTQVLGLVGAQFVDVGDISKL